LAKEALRRAISLNLDKVGFGGADLVAMEGFVARVENCAFGRQLMQAKGA
jgi:hypothetical protein